MPRYENRVQLALALVIGLLLLANLFTLTLVALTPAARPARAEVFAIVFVVTLIISVPSLLLLPRWLLKPYRQLVDAAERAPVNARVQGGEQDEAQFVLNTFHEVVAQLRSKQRELEALSAQASARAVSAEQFSERIVASVPSGLLAVDSGGRATLVNAPARVLLGIGGSAESRSYVELLGNAPEMSDLIESCLRTGDVYRREEVAARTQGGAARRLGVTVAPIELGEGRGALCLLTDITEVLQLREAVALKRNLESLGEMSAGLAHEFKNALATLHGYAQLIQTLDTDERGRAAADALLQEVRGLSEMVTSFLNFARPKPLDPADVSLSELVENCRVELEKLCGELRVEMRVEGDFPVVRADERLLRQALLNVMRNAAEAVGEESAAAAGEESSARSVIESERRVVVRGSRARGEGGREFAVVEVADTGAGIPEDDLRRIFIPFFTTKSKGHGIGLALAHRVVTDHGGTLTARNDAGGGAVFRLSLPL